MCKKLFQNSTSRVYFEDRLRSELRNKNTSIACTKLGKKLLYRMKRSYRYFSERFTQFIASELLRITARGEICDNQTSIQSFISLSRILTDVL